MRAHPNPNVGVGYERVSVLIPGKEGTSLAAQALSVDAQAAAHGAHIPPEYHISDDGVSGKRYWTRPGIQRGLSLVESKAARYLICGVVDRAARRAKISYQILERVWEADGILICNGYVFRKDDPQSKFLAGLFFSIAEWDYDNTLKKLGDGRRNCAMGLKMSHPYRMAMQRSQQPYGLVIPILQDIRETPFSRAAFPSALLGRHVIIKGDSEQARKLDLVRELFRRHDEGALLCHLCKWLRGCGIPSPRGRAWSDSTIDYMLRNEVYAGAGMMFKTTGKFDEARELQRGYDAAYRVPTDRDEWEELLPVVLYDPETRTWEEAEPVVDPELARRVREKREQDEASRAGNGRLHYYLSHFGRCSVCGGRWGAISVKQKYGDYTYYRCSGHYEDGARVAGCASKLYPYMRVETVEAAFINVLENVAKHPLLIADTIQAYEQSLYRNDTLELERDRLLHEIIVQQKRLSITIDREIEAISEGLDGAPYRAKIRELNETVKALRLELSAVESQIVPQEHESPKMRAEKLAQSIEDVRTALTAGPEDVSAEDKAAVLRHIVDRVDIDSGGHLVVTFRNLSHVPGLGLQYVGRVVTERDGRASDLTAEEVAEVLAEGEAKGVRAACAARGVSVSTYYRWRRGVGIPAPGEPAQGGSEEGTVSIVRSVQR
jgi:hypothetical protein